MLIHPRGRLVYYAYKIHFPDRGYIHPAAVAGPGSGFVPFMRVSDIVRSKILSTLIVGAEKCFTCVWIGVDGGGWEVSSVGRCQRLET